YEQLKVNNILLEHIDIGGGLGVRYDQEAPPSALEYVNALISSLKSTGLKLLIEPGRAIVAKAGILATQVLYLKRSGEKNFC
ncbi:MAG TPA: diaminopimelate decarboxylase, partial [Candidatus Berkiella sp.]|nr:diaminopimelate decarboxylase [Candidatus Berkiella sp.]